MPKFRKKPVVIEAVLWCGPEDTAMLAVLEGDSGRKIIESGDHLIISTLEGSMTANRGDWIIKGVNGELYPCKPDIFDKTYEPVD